MITNSFVTKVVVNATNAVITEASPFVIKQSPSGMTPLKLDLNGDGKIANGHELFGSATVLKSGEVATDGFHVLRDLDDNQDGLIDTNDAAFAKLKVWVDANGNGVADEGELKSLQELGIVSMKLNAQTSDMHQNGNTRGLISEYTTADGKTHQLVDVWLYVADQTTKVQNKPYELSDEALALLSMPPTDGVNMLVLSGAANDKVMLTEGEWTDTNTGVNPDGHNYAVYSGTTDSSAQLLIDQHMLQSHQTS